MVTAILQFATASPDVVLMYITCGGVLINVGMNIAILREHSRRITDLEKWRERVLERGTMARGANA